MNLYLIQWEEYDYNEFDGFVVAAETSAGARQVIEDERGRCDTDGRLWAIPGGGFDKSTIAVIGTTLTPDFPEPRIVLGSFNAG